MHVVSEDDHYRATKPIKVERVDDSYHVSFQILMENSPTYVTIKLNPDFEIQKPVAVRAPWSQFFPHQNLLTRAWRYTVGYDKKAVQSQIDTYLSDSDIVSLIVERAQTQEREDKTKRDLADLRSLADKIEEFDNVIPLFGPKKRELAEIRNIK